MGYKAGIKRKLLNAKIERLGAEHKAEYFNDLITILEKELEVKK